jgi:hypothetical protein
MWRVGSIIGGADEMVAQFVLAHNPEITHLGPFTALGVIRNDQLVAGVVYHRHRPADFDIEVTIASDTPNWAFPSTMRGLFAYPFEQLGCQRITSLIRKKNTRSRRFCEGLGFKLEGCARKAHLGREDLMIYGLLKPECRYLRKKTDG